jgi:hypothetical protein
MVKNKASRIFHLSMVAPLAVLCLLVIISFGSFTSEHVRIRANKLRTSDMHNVPRGISSDSRSPHYCILFTESMGKDTNLVVLSESPTCSFAIWGGLSVFFLSLLLGIVFAAKAVNGVSVRSCFSLVELCVIVLAALLEFSVAVVLSAGLDHTCNAFEISAGEDLPCSLYYLEFPDNTSISFYGNLITAKATAWIGTIILDVLAVVYLVLLCSYCRRQWCLGNTDDQQFKPLVMSTLAETEV